MAFLGDFFGEAGNIFGIAKNALYVLVGVGVLIICGLIIYYFFYKKKNWNLDVEFKIPRSDGRLTFAEWGRGNYDDKRGCVFVKRKGKKPVINIRGVVMNNNYKEIDDYINFWKDKVDNVTFQPIHTGLESSVHNIEEEKIKDIEIKEKNEFLNHFKKLQKKHKFLSNSYYKEFPTFFSNQNELKKKYRCFAGYHFIKIDPYGDCFQCPQMIKKVGSLKNQSLKGIWLGDDLKKWRKIVRERKNQCFCYVSYFLMNIQLNKLLKPFLKKR